MLKLTNASLRRGTKLLFSEASLTIYAGQSVGVTGANGTGKSSLFALFRDKLQLDEGECSIPQGTAISHVAQETPSLPTSALDYVLDGDRALRAAQQRYADAVDRDDGQAQAESLAQLEALDAYTAESRAARLLNGLGFQNTQINLPVSDFSGGWRMRLNLAQALMSPSDLLLLDEPTNHLDLDAVIWLETWLKSYPGTLLLISHDRDFLDRVIGHVVHIEREQVTLYTGNYSEFERQRSAHLAHQQAAYEKQQRSIAHMQSFVDRFRAKATKAKQAQSRLKALERMEQIAPAHVDSPFSFSFRRPHQLPTPLLQLETVDFGYDPASHLLKKVEMMVMPGDRIGLLGANGAGKSTLIKLLAGEVQPLNGARHEAKELRIGYFAQHQLEQLDHRDTPLEHMQRIAPDLGEKVLRDYLGGFGFQGDKALSVIQHFSGGEKARLVLATLVHHQPNLLLLDEPTNHLDLEMRHALTIALQAFEGAMIIVSHDRHLLRSTCDDLRLVSECRVTSYDDDLDGYARWLSESRQAATRVMDNRTSEHSAQARKERKREAAERRKQLQPLKRTLDKLEKQVDQLTTANEKIEAELADPNLYDAVNKDKLKALLLEQSTTTQALADAEDAWMEAQEAYEVAAADS